MNTLFKFFKNQKNLMLRECSYYKYKFSSEVEAAINKQIYVEQDAAQKYLSLAIMFMHPSSSKLGFGGYFIKMFDEEVGHMKKFIYYQLMRGGLPIINGLKSPNINNIHSTVEAFKYSLELEKEVTAVLETLISVAITSKDIQCADYVTSNFLNEQLKTINELAQHVTILSKLCDNELGLYKYDQNLAKMYPITPILNNNR